MCRRRSQRLKAGGLLARSAGESGDSHDVLSSSAEIDRIMKPDDLAQKKALGELRRAIEKERPEPIPMAMGHGRRLSLHTRRSRR